MAQNQMVCQFCENSPDIKWKCLNCDLILCEDCKTKIHTKVRSSEEHDVIDLKEFNITSANETIRILDLKNIQCPSHASEKCIIYCRDCNVLLCSTCLIESHPNHKFGKIADLYSEKVLELKDLEGKSNQHIKLFSKTEKELETMMSKGLTQYNDIIQKIFHSETEIKDAVTRQSKNLVSEMDKLWKPQESIIAQKLGEIRDKKGDLSQRVSNIEETFHSQKAISIFTAGDTIRKDLPPISATTESSMKQILLSQPRLEETIISLGSLRTIPELKVNKSFHSDLKSIFKIKTINNETNVLCSNSNAIICKFELKDSTCITTVLAKTVNVHVVDMTITKQGKLLFSLLLNSEVKCLGNLTSDSKVETFTTISPLYVRGIHATDRNILIGFRDNGKVFPLTKESRRGIIVQDYNCRHIRTLEYDINNDRIFSLPDAITTNINTDICVVDSENSEWEGRVVVLTNLGLVKWKYNGHSTINSEHKFTPFGLVTTNEGFVLVADRNSNAIHMLSMDGDLLTNLTETHGIEQPLCVNIDKSGKLLIGCSSIETSDEIAKLHVVEITV